MCGEYYKELNHISGGLLDKTVSQNTEYTERN
jgi:hypothetical protein